MEHVLVYQWLTVTTFDA